MVHWFRKLTTLLDYVRVGLEAGATWRSRLILASLLPRLKIGEIIRQSNERVWAVRIRFGDQTTPIFIRTQDVFILKEVWSDDPYCPAWLRRDCLAILDLGAHIGLATLRFKLHFPKATVHCYEPDPENFRLLEANTQRIQGVALHQEAVGGSSGEATFYTRPGQRTASSLRKPQNDAKVVAITCRVRSLDDILRELGPVDLIKFDIEGAEWAVFRASHLVHEVPFIVGELKGDESECADFLELFPSHDGWYHNSPRNVHYVYLLRRDVRGKSM